MKLVFWLIAAWILYRLIGDVILPLSNSGKKAKKQFNDIKSKQEQGFGHTTVQEKKPAAERDYIEFEEIKS